MGQIQYVTFKETEKSGTETLQQLNSTDSWCYVAAKVKGYTHDFLGRFSIPFEHIRTLHPFGRDS